jgi:DNA-binding FadR family transcriptional regulator
MPLQSIETRRLYQQIAQQLRQLILNGEFAPGSRLPAERELASQLGVSRPSVREALIALEVEGWVEVRTGSGVYVQDRSALTGQRVPATEWGPLEVIRARRVVEGEIAALAALHAEPAHIEGLQEALALMRAHALAGRAPLEGDRAFHLTLAAACGNAVLADTVAQLWDARKGPLFERLGDYFENPISWQSAIEEHQAVLAAVTCGAAEAARQAMQHHMDQSHERFNASWPKH